ncbi:MAG: KEOPS complex subunit Cgi121 [Candidatus Thorarchaeota archaeon]|jgi:tRNA threonylcarbamoyladenosine modification (KEOPS) complex Cgi121 subunit
MTVRVETLTYEDEVFHVGIGELANAKSLSKDEMVSLASEKKDGIIAIQLLDSTLVAGEVHLLSATQNALNAWKGTYAISRSLDVEILLYASGQHQIGVAIDKLGIRYESTSVAAVVLAVDESNLKSHVDYLVDKLGPEVQPPFVPTEERIQNVMMHFGINEAEIAAVASSDSLEARYQALSGCVTSRVSMVALES